MVDLKKIKNVIIVLVCLVLMFFIVQAFLKKPNLMPVKGQIDEIDLTGVNKLMIISHPGDESVWGGVHLLTDNYLVVCVSCGYDDEKTNDFKDAINFSGDKYIMMGYSDKIYFNKDYKKIKKQIKYILSYKNWSEVVTHNPLGEYNNYQHKQISDILTDLNVSNLYYFGKYYSEKELNKLDKETFLDGDLIKSKIKNMVKKYDGIYDDYKHMLPFEEWIEASKWEN